MKPLPILYVSILVLTTLAMSAAGVFASINYNASKSNTGNFTLLNPSALGAEKACADSGGSVFSDSAGTKACLKLKKAKKIAEPVKPEPPNPN
jgi:hypothetical protein